MRILVIESDAQFRKFLMGAIGEAGYPADAAAGIQVALRLGTEMRYNCVVADFDATGEAVVPAMAALQKAGMTCPLLALTSSKNLEDRLHLLENGAADVLVRPFALPEFLARMRNLLPKEGSTALSSTQLRVMDLELDLIRREVRRSARAVELTSQEFAMLEFLCRNAGRVVTRSMMLESTWTVSRELNPTVIDVHMSRLRAKVDLRDLPPLIYTVRGLGYVVRNFALESQP